jgi:hypothetical protein
MFNDLKVDGWDGWTNKAVRDSQSRRMSSRAALAAYFGHKTVCVWRGEPQRFSEAYVNLGVDEFRISAEARALDELARKEVRVAHLEKAVWADDEF